MTWRRRRTACLLASAAVAASVVAPARADTVTDWNVHAANALITTAGQSPSASAVTLAMVHGAMHDAVAAIHRRYEPYAYARRAPRWYAADAAAATAAHRVLLDLVPAQRPALDAAYAASLATVPPGRARDGGVAVGAAAAATMLAIRTGDGRFGPYRFPVGEAVGVWRPTPPLFVNDPNAWVARTAPFLVEDPAAFRSRGPAPLTSRRYARELAEVQRLGAVDSTVRTEDMTRAARFWSGGYAPWVLATRDLVARHRLSLPASARLFALLYLNAADAGISCWADKARWLRWRPVTAIHEAARDGNPATQPDPAWQSLVPAPSYPDHPSGLTCFGGAITGTLRHVFGERVSFTVTGASGEQRSFRTLSGALREAVDARVWSGIHFRSADEQGARLGLRVARYGTRAALRPVHRHGG